MGFFSRFSPKVYDVGMLSEDQKGMLRLFFERGWAQEVRRRGGIGSAFDSVSDRALIKGLKKGFLTADEIDCIVALLRADMRYNGEDPTEQEIIKVLEWSKTAE